MKIFIYHYNLELGGIERSLIGLLKNIDYSIHSVDLFLVKHEGVLLAEVPNEVNMLPVEEASYALGTSVKDLFKKGYIRWGYIRLIGTLRTRFLSAILHKHRSAEYTSQYVYPKIIRYFQKQLILYDLAISFSWPAYYIMQNIDAKYRVCWVHTDYTKIYPDLNQDLYMWKAMDSIAAVSEGCANTFKTVFPMLRDRVITIENVLDCDFIRKKSIEETIYFDKRYVNILSVGRFCEAKNFDNVPEICNILLKKGVSVKWYLIGFGADEELIKNKIKEFQMENHVIILGKKENPYPYMAACDIYVQPSRFEGKAVTVREAQVLNKPVVITDFRSASSQVRHGYDGWIVPLDNMQCAEGLFQFIQNIELQKKLIQNTKLSDYSNTAEVKKIFELVGGGK